MLDLSPSSTTFNYIEITSTPPEIMPSLLPNPQPNYSYSLSLLATFLPLVFRSETAATVAASAVVLAFSAAAVIFFASLSPPLPMLELPPLLLWDVPDTFWQAVHRLYLESGGPG